MLNRSTLTAVAVALLLAIGLAAVYLPQLLPALGGAPPLAANDELTYITDLDFWQRTPRERTVAAAAPLLTVSFSAVGKFLQLQFQNSKIFCF